ncbi:nuclear transport factor 2 family protein [Thalassobellus citreus]|uniref:nuclear transport factor 2 family protein n=1 Tax=Thalassobellus citreus TaxID=3367752 RepID=UPI0037899756
MKKLFLIATALVLFIACQNKPQRYFEESAEIETVKAGIKAYEAQDWTKWKANFADTAKIFHNTNKGATPNEMMTGMTQMLSNFSSYGFSKKGGVSEMVIDKDGKTWVNYWNNWNGTSKITEKKLVIPVHLTIEFIEGKIVQEYAYYDTAGINKVIASEIAAQMETETEVSEE